MDGLLGPIFPRTVPDEIQKEVLLRSLTEAGFDDVLATALARFTNLEPPPLHEADHAAFSGWLSRATAEAAVMSEAIADADLPRVHLAMSETTVTYGMGLLEVSPAYCETIMVAPGGAPTGFGSPCDPSPADAGEYGTEVFRVAKSFALQFQQRAGFPEGMTQDELLAGLAYVQPAIVSTFEETLAELDRLDPPADRAVGHDVLRDYFTELLSTARAIDRAVAERDHIGVQREFERSNSIFETARDRLPRDYRPLVAPVFGPG